MVPLARHVEWKVFAFPAWPSGTTLWKTGESPRVSAVLHLRDRSATKRLAGTPDWGWPFLPNGAKGGPARGKVSNSRHLRLEQSTWKAHIPVPW